MTDCFRDARWRQGHAVGVLDHVALGIFPDQRPGWLETAARLHKNKIRTSRRWSTWNTAMSSVWKPNEQDYELDTAVEQALAVCGGDMGAAVRALIVANNYLESEIAELNKAVSHAYKRGRFRTYTG
jgi:hypothetical protein